MNITLLLQSVILPATVSVLTAATIAEIPVEWVTTYTDQPPYAPVAFDVDSAGNSFVIATIGETTSADLAITKFDADGDFVWQSEFAGPVGSDVAIDLEVSADEMAVFAVGRSAAKGIGNSDYAIIKYDAATGAEQWHVFYDGPTEQLDDPHAAAATPDGGIAVTGGVFNGNEQYDYGTIKLSVDGDLDWDATFSDNGPFLINDDRGMVIAIAGNGDVVVSGNARPASGGDDIVTIRYDAKTGNQLWLARYSTSANERVNDITIAPNGDIIVFGSDPFGIDRQWVTVRYAGATGAEQWVSLIDPGNDEGPQAVTTDAAGDVYITGATDPDGNDGNINENLITISLDGATGATRWLDEFGGIDFNEAESGRDIYADNQGSIFVVGSTATAALTGDSINTDAIIWQYDAASGELVDMELVDTSTKEGPIRDDLFAQLGVDAAGDIYARGSVFIKGEPTRALLAKFLAGPDDPLPGDLDRDGDVDFDDFTHLLASWGDPGCNGTLPCLADLDGDGDVDFDDFTALLANWT